jgi:predicted AAA+ superfamily ATPase
MNTDAAIFAVLADILGLSLFSGLRESLLLGSFKNLVESISEEKTQDAMFFAQSNATLDLVEKWAAFIEAFTEEQKGYSFYLTLASMTTLDENAFTLAAEAREGPLPPLLLVAAKTDLSRLGRIASFDIPGLGFSVAETCRKAGLEQIALNIEEESRVIWAAEGKKAAAPGAAELLDLFPADGGWGAAVPAFTEYLRRRGAGFLGSYRFFRWEWADASMGLLSLSPVKNPDPVRLEDLAAYEAQRSVVLANTLRFLEGRPANNLLLYGDRGTGKSATVKAICNEYADRGLRLLEVHKGDLSQIPAIMELLSSRGRRFIIFIDDLSFERLDDSFTELKALLEGGVEARPSNVLIYATSNRRHLVRERFAGADEGGEVRSFDTVEEQLSLADRFGVTVVFSAPSQEEYLLIAGHIAARRGLLPETEGESFRENALRWERWFNGRSPRTAVQYVDWLAGGGGFPWDEDPVSGGLS